MYLAGAHHPIETHLIDTAFDCIPPLVNVFA